MPEPEAEEYPYGTQIELTSEQVEEMGLKCAVGDEVMLSGKAKVVAQSEYGEGQAGHITLQLTDVDVKKESESAETILYG